jgi:hypothetical protein
MAVCPISGCGDALEKDKVLCPLHWRLVAPEVVREMYRAKAHLKRDNSPLNQDIYREALNACVESAREMVRQ